MSSVEETMKIIGVKTVRELASICKVSEKTVTGWKKNLPSYGEAILTLIVENYDLKKELEASRSYKKALNEFISNG